MAVILIAAGILIYRASLKSSVDALLLLKNLSGRKELDMTASVQMELGDETLPNGRAPVPHAGRWEHHPLHRG